MNEQQGRIALFSFECDTLGEYLDTMCMQFDNLTLAGQQATLYLVSCLLKITGPVEYHDSIWYDKGDVFESVKIDKLLENKFKNAFDIPFPHEEHVAEIEKYFSAEKREKLFESLN